MANFALIGAAGFVAERHMRAISDTGHQLVAALDPHDNVGVLDRYFPDTHFFVEFERFDRHIDKLRRRGESLSYISVCSPNYLHDSHIRFGLRSGADVICEKPLVLNPWNLDAIADIERESAKRVYNVLPLRLHPSIIRLREEIAARVAVQPDAPFDVDLSYITSRGRWYRVSWKGQDAKSGGVATNIGVHFFDMLSWVFGPLRESTLHQRSDTTAAGLLELAHARVRWLLSIDERALPHEVCARGGRTYRSIRVEGEELEFSDGFTDLHTRAYEEILAGRGCGIEQARPAIQLVHDLRQKAPVARRDGSMHPLAERLLKGGS